MIVIVMGVTGCGKSTVGRLVAARLGWAFYDGDDFHLPASVEKMRRGVPLTDDDRWPWLDRLRDLGEEITQRGQSAVIACSALRASYRDRLLPRDAVVSQVIFVYLRISPELARERLAARPDHYMPVSLIESQFATLEEPTDGTGAMVLDGAQSIETLVAGVVERLQRTAGVRR